VLAKELPTVMPDAPDAPKVFRGEVGPGDLRHVQEHYRGLAHQCISEGWQRALIVGHPGHDAWTHVVVKDVVYSMAIAGVPQGFRLALVSSSLELAQVYEAAVAYAGLRGIDARRCATEEEAMKWLLS
jgi:hypothetical protein